MHGAHLFVEEKRARHHLPATHPPPQQLLKGRGISQTVAGGRGVPVASPACSPSRYMQGLRAAEGIASTSLVLRLLCVLNSGRGSPSRPVMPMGCRECPRLREGVPLVQPPWPS